MDRTWVKVLVVIAVIVVSILVGMCLMASYQATSVRTQPCVPCMITYTDTNASALDAWATEPFRIAPVEHGIYRIERTEERERDDTEL